MIHQIQSDRFRLGRALSQVSQICVSFLLIFPVVQFGGEIVPKLTSSVFVMAPSVDTMKQPPVSEILRKFGTFDKFTFLVY